MRRVLCGCDCVVYMSAQRVTASSSESLMSVVVVLA
jgi:hypothetical protein